MKSSTLTILDTSMNKLRSIITFLNNFEMHLSHATTLSGMTLSNIPPHISTFFVQNGKLWREWFESLRLNLIKAARMTGSLDSTLFHAQKVNFANFDQV